MTNYENLLVLSKKEMDNITQLYDSGGFEDIDKCVMFVEDLNHWIQCCENFEDNPLVTEAQDECCKSILLCAQGLYKESISILRQFLEHMLFAVLLSTNDFNYKLWRLDGYDMSWKSIMDEQKGVFGKDFIRIYGREISEERSIELITIAKNVYRECSEYIHGNCSKLISLSNAIEYNENMNKKFFECFYSIKYVVSMALLIRFRGILDDREILKQLETVIMDNVGELPEVQYIYSKDEV